MTLQSNQQGQLHASWLRKYAPKAPSLLHSSGLPDASVAKGRKTFSSSHYSSLLLFFSPSTQIILLSLSSYLTLYLFSLTFLFSLPSAFTLPPYSLLSSILRNHQNQQTPYQEQLLALSKVSESSLFFLVAVIPIYSAMGSMQSPNTTTRSIAICTFWSADSTTLHVQPSNDFYF